jgi:hypothetical protein
MTARILKTLALALVLGGVFAGSALAQPIVEPSIYSTHSAAPVVHPIVSEKVAGLHAVVPAGILSDRGVLSAQDSGLVPTLAMSDRGVLTAKDAGLQSQTPELLASSGDGFNWGDASIGAGVAFAALLVLTGVALTARRHYPVAH